MKKYWWYLICEIMFGLTSIFFAWAGSGAWLYLMGMALWMMIMALRENYKKGAVKNREH